MLNRIEIPTALQNVMSEYAQDLDLKKEERLGLVLAGGGAKGRWQAGFLAFLSQLGLLQEVDVVAGTSVGGLNSLLVAKYRDEFEKAITVWENIRSNKDVYDGSLPRGGWSALLLVLAGKLTGESVLSNTPLRLLADKLFGQYRAQSDMLIPAYVVTTDRTDGSSVVLGPLSNPVDMAISTSSVPAAFPAYNNVYMDGGCSMNVPFPVIIEQGKATKVIVLYCDPDRTNALRKVEPPTVLSNGLAAINALFNVQEELSWKLLDGMQHVRKAEGLDPIEFAQFYPSAETGQLLEFSNLDVLQKGYDDAVRFVTEEKLRAFLLA